METRLILKVNYYILTTVRRGGNAGVTLFFFFNLKIEKPRYQRSDIEIQSIAKYYKARYIQNIEENFC